MKRMFLGKMSNRISFSLLCLALLTIILSSAVLPEERVKLKVAIAPFLSYAPFFVGIEERYFAEEGIDIEFVRFRIHGDQLPALAQGQIDVAGGTVSAGFFNAVARGMKLRIVADRGHTSQGSGYTGIIVRKDLYDEGELRCRADLRGKKVALGTVGGGAHFYLGRALEEAGLTFDDIEIVRLGFTDAIQALKTGGIDAAVSAEPLITVAERAGVVVRLESYGDYFPNQQEIVVFYGPNLLEKAHDVGRKFMLAYLKAVKTYNQGKTPRNIEIIQKYTKLDKDLLEECFWPVINDNGEVFTHSILAYQDWLYEKGFVDSKVKPEEMIDTSFIDWANEELSGE